MRKVVGISQKTKRAWLDAALDRLVETRIDAELRTFLDKHLKNELPGKESRAKSIGIILRVWSGVPGERVSLRDRAVEMLPRISGQERIWLHWGMTALAYPFFRDTAEVVGRLLALQDDFTTAQVQGRMLTTWGDRATTKEAVQKLITTLVDWEVLRSTKMKGHFLLTRKMKASIPDLQLWLLEALLAASAADEIEAQQLLRLPESFPFALNVGVADLRKHEGFNIHRQGLDMDMVALRKVKSEAPPKPTKKSHKVKTAKDDGPSLFDTKIEDDISSNGSPDAILVAQAKTEARGNRSGDLAQRYRGQRAEHVASWYFRLNGFLSIPGFVVHPDIVRRNPMTEADLISVRFPHSREVIGGRLMEDDERLVKLATKGQVLFLLVEVKLDLCNINGPWSDSQQGNMQRVVRRLGFADESKVEQIAAVMYRDLRWEDEQTVLQYVSVGNRLNDGRGRQYPKLLQVSWNHIADFLFERFRAFPEKLPSGGLIHQQWPNFGRKYGEQFRQMKSVQQSQEFVSAYIEHGRAATRLTLIDE